MIWSPAKGKDVQLRKGVGGAEVESLLQSKLPPGLGITCEEEGNVEYVGCLVRVPSRKKEVALYVFIGEGGKLMPKAGERLPREMWTCPPDGDRDPAYSIC